MNITYELPEGLTKITDVDDIDDYLMQGHPNVCIPHGGEPIYGEVDNWAHDFLELNNIEIADHENGGEFGEYDIEAETIIYTCFQNNGTDHIDLKLTGIVARDAREGQRDELVFYIKTVEVDE